MSERNKKNFKVRDLEDWDTGLRKCEQMRRAGYDIDMTMVLNAAVERFAAESAEDTAKRMGIQKGEEPVAAWRNPYPRTVSR